jgi:hypothetical protein
LPPGVPLGLTGVVPCIANPPGFSARPPGRPSGAYAFFGVLKWSNGYYSGGSAFIASLAVGPMRVRAPDPGGECQLPPLLSALRGTGSRATRR